MISNASAPKNLPGPCCKIRVDNREKIRIIDRV